MRRLRWLLPLLAFLAGPLTPARAVEHDCPIAAPQRLALPASRAAIAAGGPLEIVALGSSSTEGSGATRPEFSYPARLEARLRRALAGVAVHVHNLGRGGDTAPDMLARLERNGLGERPPALVIWQAGTNDALRQRDPDAFRAEMEAGLARLLPAGTDVVLMDSQRAPRVLAAPGHERFDRNLAELASAHHLGLFSRDALMRDWQRAGVPATAMLGEDGLHHNDRGYDCLGRALAGAIVAAVRAAPVVAGR